MHRSGSDDSDAPHITEIREEPEPQPKPDANAAAAAEGPILLPAFGFRESAHAVDGKIAKWVQQALEQNLPGAEKALEDAKTERDTVLRAKNEHGDTPGWQKQWAKVNPAFQAAQKAHATLQGLIKKIKDKRLTFSVKVPHAMTLRQLGPLIAKVIQDEDGNKLPEYIQRQCTRDQVQRWYTQMKIIHEDKVQKRKAEHDAQVVHGWDSEPPPDLPPVSETFIHDDAFSTTPLPAMEDSLKVMMKFQDVHNMEKFVK